MSKKVKISIAVAVIIICIAAAVLFVLKFFSCNFETNKTRFNGQSGGYVEYPYISSVACIYKNKEANNAAFDFNTELYKRVDYYINNYADTTQIDCRLVSEKDGEYTYAFVGQAVTEDGCEIMVHDEMKFTLNSVNDLKAVNVDYKIYNPSVIITYSDNEVDLQSSYSYNSKSSDENTAYTNAINEGLGTISFFSQPLSYTLYALKDGEYQSVECENDTYGFEANTAYKLTLDYGVNSIDYYAEV